MISMQVYDRSRDAGWNPATQARWQVRWRDGDGRQRKKSFDYKTEAQSFADRQAGRRKLRDQNRTVAEQWDDYRAIRDTKSDGHKRNIDATWNQHVRDKWGDTQLAKLRHGEIAAWATRLERDQSDAIAARALDLLNGLCILAIRDEVLDRNPCDDISIEVTAKRQQRFLTRAELDQVADAMGGNDRLAVLVLGLTGMRWGELAGLQVRDLDTKRRRIHIRRHVTEVGGHLETVEGTKTDGGREITAPKSIIDELAKLAKGRAPTAPLLPAARGGIRRHSRFYAQWRKKINGSPDVKRRAKTGPIPTPGLGVDAHIHDLRHTAASLMIKAGADVKVVQRQLGHKSATLTMDLYSHLFNDSLDDLSAALDRID